MWTSARVGTWLNKTRTWPHIHQCKLAGSLCSWILTEVSWVVRRIVLSRSKVSLFYFMVWGILLMNWLIMRTIVLLLLHVVVISGNIWLSSQVYWRFRSWTERWLLLWDRFLYTALHGFISVLLHNRLFTTILVNQLMCTVLKRMVMQTKTIRGKWC